MPPSGDLGDLNQTISDISMAAVGIGAAALAVLVILALIFNKRAPKSKVPLFILILLVIIGTTLTISGGTVYLNLKSATGGPVHWHADFEIWACNNELELRDPTGFLSNKIGSPTYHEHNDKRIHLEGVPVVMPRDASLGYFMQTIGGGLSSSTLVVPLNEDNYFADKKGAEDGDGPAKTAPEEIEPYIKTDTKGKVASFISGEACGQDQAEVQVFLYKFDEAAKTYRQEKLQDAVNYDITQDENVPPGDCIIMEFAPPKDRTDKLCKQYGVRDQQRCGEFGVPADRRQNCDIKEVQ